ncbi:hypothetical protein TI04_05100 [Achromatium sp. WMS2]|nr:hypothetical protein TI04_05100 [Achromatium sp. WMS2]
MERGRGVRSILPLLDAVKVRTGKVGRSKKHFKVLAADKGYHSKDLRKCLRKRGTRLQIPKRIWNDKKPHGRPLKNDTPRFQAERGHLPGYKGNTADWWYVGNVYLSVSMRFLPWVSFIHG